MTDNEINRKISELQEPFEGLPSGDKIEKRDSPKGKWCFRNEEWHPLFWTENEFLNAKLLEEMPAPTLHKDEVQKPQIHQSWWCKHDWGVAFVANHDSRKHAVALAWIEWKTSTYERS